MRFELPENKGKIHWTQHVKNKMRGYLLSEKRVLKVLRSPERKEEGIAPRTLAAMQSYGTKRYPKEIWVMYQISGRKANRKLKIISAWRYPGRSPLNKLPTIPEDILEELKNLI